MEITFTNTTEFPMEGYEPVPSKKVIPDWYKNLESYMNGKKIPNGEGSTLATIKRCMPVFDALTTGYIIVSPVDIYVSKKENKFWYEWPSENPISFHPVEQAPNHPLANGENYPKWINPWSIETPKGYSCLFVPPFHRKNPFVVLEGIVDTDTYKSNVNFPFVMTDLEFEGLIPAGTPIVQVIPFKREEWTMRLGCQKEIETATKIGKLLRKRFFDSYKTQFRQEKDYS